jgi:hypothetical protein
MQPIRKTVPASFLLVCLLSVTPLSGQQDAKPNSPTLHDAHANASLESKPGEFTDKETDLQFNYPVEMSRLDTLANMESGHESWYGVSGENDPEHQKAKNCFRSLLDVELPENYAPDRLASLDGVWVDDTKEYKESAKPESIIGRILLIEIVRSCLPKKLQNHDDDALREVAMELTSAPGIEPVSDPFWLEVAEQKMHVNSGCGRLIVNGQLAPSPVVLLSMSTTWHGHLLLWVFTSNDRQTFDEMTKSLVKFGNGSWATMFTPNLGAKGTGFTSLKILPK